MSCWYALFRTSNKNLHFPRVANAAGNCENHTEGFKIIAPVAQIVIKPYFPNKVAPPIFDFHAGEGWRVGGRMDGGWAGG